MFGSDDCKNSNKVEDINTDSPISVDDIKASEQSEVEVSSIIATSSLVFFETIWFSLETFKDSLHSVSATESISFCTCLSFFEKDFLFKLPISDWISIGPFDLAWSREELVLCTKDNMYDETEDCSVEGSAFEEKDVSCNNLIKKKIKFNAKSQEPIKFGKSE